MKFVLVIKLVLSISLAVLGYYFWFINSEIDKEISQKSNTWSHYKNNPKLDSSTNRIIYLQKKEQYYKDYKELTSKKKSPLYRVLGFLLTILSINLIRRYIVKLWRIRKQ